MPGISRSERARGDGTLGEEERNSTVGEPGGRRECSVGVNFRACSLGVGEVWMKTVRYDVGRCTREGNGRDVAGRVKYVR